MQAKGETAMMMKYIAWVLIVAFMNLTIAPGIAHAGAYYGDINSGGDFVGNNGALYLAGGLLVAGIIVLLVSTKKPVGEPKEIHGTPPEENRHGEEKIPGHHPERPAPIVSPSGEVALVSW
jgi:hypothetical protein